MTSTKNNNNTSSSGATCVAFSHVELYVEHLEDLNVYKDLEEKVSSFKSKVQDKEAIQTRQQKWCQIAGTSSTPTDFVPQNQDIVQQLIVGLNFRITRVSTSGTTRSVLVTSSDASGVQFLVTAPNLSSSATPEKDNRGDDSELFSLEKHRRFVNAHDGHMGIGILAFKVGDVEGIKERYERKHPALIASYAEIPNDVKVLEVFAYYKNHPDNGNDTKEADLGTVLRFVQSPNDEVLYSSMGLDAVDASFDGKSHAAYFDHWVSNVFSRTEFIDTLQDTLGFSPKVDFNAGVVAAGEAQIESTVTGNTSLVAGDPTEALRDQSQVYLPINNALSPVGHVHGFLQELGQGVQHIASRVENIVDFVQETNDMRKTTGEGFTFLRIPRSYYGILSLQDLVEDGVDKECGLAILDALRDGGVLAKDGALDLDLTRTDVDRILNELILEGTIKRSYEKQKDRVLEKVCFSRYRNLYALLGDHVSEATYLAIVRNQILVDIQGDDLLYQIFTCNILQRNAGDEAPFLEFIQRVCSECKDADGCPRKVKPGCGGFGIRNFLTLFLSIEVSKAIQEVSDARDEGNSDRERYAQNMVDCFTSQLNEANPILTAISDAMTEEGKCKEMIVSLEAQGGDEGTIAQWTLKEAAAAQKKEEGNARLMECSSRYNQEMRMLRETQPH